MKEEYSFPAGLDKLIDPLIVNAINSHVFPGVAVGISLKCGSLQKNYSAVWGDASFFPRERKMTKNTFFDLASLTKPFATTLALLCLLHEGKIELDENLPSLLLRKIPADKKKITLRQLLNHCSGLAAHRPFFEKLMLYAEKERKSMLLDKILEDDLVYPSGTKALYSDLGFILLGMIIELKSGQPLEVYVEEKVTSPLVLADHILFNPLRKNKKNFAATENCPWRKRILSGEVHDDNTYAVGGVSGQAGLFGTIDSVLHLASFLLEVWQNRAHHPNFSAEQLQQFLTRQDIVKESTWALGFDTPSPAGSSAGKYINPASVGHLGFTGTSFWIDPQRELVMVLLTNRVHPSRQNNRIREFRPLFHDRVIEFIS